MTDFSVPVGRQPRGIVYINDVPLESGWIDFEVSNTGYYAADTFEVHLACGKLPQYRDANWFSRQQDMFVELAVGEASADGSAFKSWIYGQVDTTDYDPIAGVMTLSGRDLTRVFIDSKTTDKWTDQTASQIATMLAKKHGLDVQVAATTQKVGTYYRQEHAMEGQEKSEWDILSFLAAAEDFVVFVRGRTLYFLPRPADAQPYPILVHWVGGVPQGNFSRLRTARALTVSRGIQVVIRSYHHGSAQGYEVTYPVKTKSIQPGRSQIGTGTQVYAKFIANLTREQALKRAQEWYSQLVRHEMKIEVEMPGDNDLDVNGTIRLSGTETAFDQVYFPESIHRRVSLTGGYEMTVHAKNHSPDSVIGAL